MKKKILILFTLISSLALSDSRDLKMKMVLNKEDVNQILIDIVPEDWEEKKIIQPVEEVIKKQEETKTKKIVKKKTIKKKPIEVIKKEEIKPIEEIKIEKVKPIKDQETKLVEPIEQVKPTEVIKDETKVVEDKKSNKIQIIMWSIVGAFVILFNRIIKRRKGGK